MNNIVLDTDSYKFSHWLQYPPGTTGMFSYLESRGGRYANTVFFGLQMLLKKYLCRAVTAEEVFEAEAFAKMHGLPFNSAGWDRIVQLGYFPIRIRAVPEGTVVPVSNALMTCESTDPDTFWIVSYLETLLMRIWYPITVCTQSWHIRQLIYDYLKRTSDTPDQDILFKLHDFGSRGVSSQESAEHGGAAHLVNFMGSDTVAGVWAANHYYHSPMAGFSIPAMEHSSVTSWGRDGEVLAFGNMLEHFAKPGKLVACVSDSYDIYHAVSQIWGEALRQRVIDSGATVVIRPDSGHPPKVVLDVLTILDEKFGSTRTAQGNYKVLQHVRVIQGDGINEDMIREILETITRAGFSAANVAFGMGGALLQQVNRDTQRFAYKCSSVTINEVDIDVSKSPATDPGKNSKAGRLDLNMKNGQYETVRASEAYNSKLQTVFHDGQLLVDENLDTIRARAQEGNPS